MSGVQAMGLSIDDSSYGQDTAPHKFFKVKDFKWDLARQHVKGEQVSSLGVEDSVVGLFDGKGSFNSLVYPNYLPYLLRSLYGGLSTTGPVDSQYTHVLTPDAARQSLTLSVTRDANKSNIMETLPGAVITEVKFAMKAGQPVMAAWTFFARTMNLDSRAAPSFDTDPPLVMHTSDDYYKLDGDAITGITAAEVTIKKNYPSLDAESEIGSQFRASATPGFITMEGTMDRVFKDDSQLNEFLGSNSAVEPAEDVNTQALDIRSKSNTLIGATSVYQMNILADRIIYDTRGSQESKQDLEVENIKWFAENDGTSDFIACNVKNSRATYTN